MAEIEWRGGDLSPAKIEVPESPIRLIDRPVRSYGAGLDAWREELAEAYALMRNFTDMDSSEVFLHLSQFSSRASEMRSMLGPEESKREYAFRTRIIDPFIEECDRQFKIHSRIQAIAEMDAKLAGGRFT